MHSMEPNRAPRADLGRTDTAPRARRARIRRTGGVLKKALIALAVLVVVAVVAAVLFLDSIARAGIAAAGQYALGTKTSVREASIGIVSGKTAIRGLEVDNPAGYSPEKFVSLGAIEVDAGLSSFTGDKIDIARVAVEELVVEIEKKDGVLNVQKFVDHLKEVTGHGESKPAEPAGESKEAIIRELRIEKCVVKLRNLAGGKDGVVEVKLPDIVLRDLSSKGGVDMLASEVSGVVIGSVMQAVVAANIEGLGAEVVGGLKGAAEGIGQAIGGELSNAVGKGVEGAAEALKGLGEGLSKELGNLGKNLGEGAGKALEGAGKAVGEGLGGALEGVFGGKKN
jgi:hypothetical protein